MQRKTRFVTSDDRFFNNKSDALRHQFMLDMASILEDEDPCTPDSVRNTLLALFHHRASSFA